MDKLRDFVVFNSVVEHGSFAKAAEALDLRAAVVTRSVKELEDGLGVRLINRTTRRMSLTAVGDDVFAMTRRLLAVYDELLVVGRATTTEARGVVRLAAPAFFARHRLGAALAAYVAAHPQVRIDLRVTERGAGLGGDTDLELCLEDDLRDSQVARRIAIVPLLVCASGDYVRRRGAPGRPEDLAGHDCVCWDGSRNGADWQFLDPLTGERRNHAVHPCLQSSHADVLLHATERGAGIAILPDFLVRDALAEGRLLHLLPAARPAPLSIHLAYGSHAQQPLAVRRLIEHLTDSFADDAPPRAVPARRPRTLAEAPALA